MHHDFTTSEMFDPVVPVPNLEMARVFFQTHMLPGSVHEIRILPRDRGGTAAGYVDSPARGAALACKWNGTTAKAVYVTLNPVNPALLARAKNRIQDYAKDLTKDADVSCIRNILIDVDPVRPAGISATDAERAAALETTASIEAYLTGEGWPLPVVSGTSGNGGQLIYRLIDLPNTPESVVLVKGTLASLASRFDSNVATVDTSNYNPSRICKIPGTIAAKGDHVPDRPWRRAEAVCRG